MTPEEIKAGRTYETKSGNVCKVDEINDGVVWYDHDAFGYVYSSLSHFASLCVRDITPAPESDQGEKVAQAQSQVSSRGCGDGLVRKFASDVAEYLYDAGHRDDGPSSSDGTRLLRQAREIAQEPPYAAAVNADLLEACKAVLDARGLIGECKALGMVEAAIARAEAGTPSHPRFRHRRTGDIYELLLIANEHAERTAQYPPTAVYRRVSDRTVWSRPVQDWGKDFEEVTGNE